MPITNNSEIKIVIGRFTIIGGEKLPDVAYTDAEQEAIDRLLEAGRLIRGEAPAMPEPAPEPEVDPEPAPEPAPEPEPASEPEADPEPEANPISKMTKDELKAYVDENGLGIELDMSKRVAALRKEVQELADNS